MSTFKVSVTCLKNDGGHGCKIPFEYDDKTYTSCARAGGYDTPWCYDVRGWGNWDYCSNCNQGIWVHTTFIHFYTIYIHKNLLM